MLLTSSVLLWARDAVGPISIRRLSQTLSPPFAHPSRGTGSEAAVLRTAPLVSVLTWLAGWVAVFSLFHDLIDGMNSWMNWVIMLTNDEKWLCDNTRIVTVMREKPVQLKAACWKSPVRSVYLNVRELQRSSARVHSLCYSFSHISLSPLLTLICPSYAAHHCQTFNLPSSLLRSAAAPSSRSDLSQPPSLSHHHDHQSRLC